MFRSLRRYHAYLFVAPALLFYALVVLRPVLHALWISLHDFQLGRPANPFVGLRNYRYLFAEDPLFLYSLRITVLFTVGAVVATTFIGLALALLLNRALRLRKFFRMAHFVPAITPVIPVAIVWSYLYQPSLGVLNGLLVSVGLPRVQWVTSGDWVLPSLIILTVWRYMGYAMVIYLAGLQGVPHDPLEAALVDGANAWQRFWAVTWPALLPTTLFVIVTSTIGTMQSFGEVYVLTGGGPGDASRVLSLYIYQTAFEYLRLGRASAMAFVLFVIIFALALVQLRLGRERA